MKGTTVFERWKESRRDTEEVYLNPLDARLGDIVNVDLPDQRDLDFSVTQFRVLTREIGDQKFPITDYYLLARSIDNEETRILLRFIPLDEPDKDSGLTHAVYLLTLVDEHEHDQEVMDVLALNEGYTYARQTDEGDWEEIPFPSRVNDIKVPYACAVDIVKDADHDGEVERDEVESHRLAYWDFWRSLSKEGDGPVEYLFIEVDEKDGWTELFLGEEIDQDVVQKS